MRKPPRAAGWKAATADRQGAREATAGISAVYHPYRLSDGQRQSPEAVEGALNAKFAAASAIARKAELPERCHAGIAKAQRVTSAMVETIRYVHAETTACLLALSLPDDLRTEVAERLVPSLYLNRVAGRAATAQERRRLTTAADTLRAPLLLPDHCLNSLPEERREEIQTAAETCADLFQRSSSCVEGRNGQLSLYHHRLHALRGDKLSALTAVHNYYVTREDGTTPAERFFGSPPDDMFDRLVKRMPMPPRPARKRTANSPSKTLPLA